MDLSDSGSDGGWSTQSSESAWSASNWDACDWSREAQEGWWSPGSAVAETWWPDSNAAWYADHDPAAIEAETWLCAACETADANESWLEQAHQAVTADPTDANK